jgi:hypothetical protein
MSNISYLTKMIVMYLLSKKLNKKKELNLLEFMKSINLMKKEI